MVDSKEVAVVGLGPAGVSAAIYLYRYGMTPFCFEKELVGGKVNKTEKIENYAGVGSIKGPQLGMEFEKQLSSFSIKPIYKEVKKITLNKDGTFRLEYGKDVFHDFKYVILANGLEEAPFPIQGEDNFSKRGISRCAICDGPFYRGKDVAVIGGGNSAFEEAAYLASICNHVSLIARRKEFRAQQVIVDKFKALNNISVYAPYQVYSASGDDRIESLLIENKENGEKINLLIQGLFIYIGEKPAHDFLQISGLEDEKGYFYVNEDKMTKVKNLYAIGDCATSSLKQVATAVSDGAICASRIFKDYQEGR